MNGVSYFSNNFSLSPREITYSLQQSEQKNVISRTPHENEAARLLPRLLIIATSPLYREHLQKRRYRDEIWPKLSNVFGYDSLWNAKKAKQR